MGGEVFADFLDTRTLVGLVVEAGHGDAVDSALIEGMRGDFHRRGPAPEPAVVEGMNETLRHRGPDSGGLRASGPAADVQAEARVGGEAPERSRSSPSKSGIMWSVMTRS